MITRAAVTENNGGGLTLFVWGSDKDAESPMLFSEHQKTESIIYSHCGYEYDNTHTQLRENLEKLESGVDPIADDWDGNEAGEYEYDDHPSTGIIVTYNFIDGTFFVNDREDMGHAGSLALYGND